MHIIYLSWEYHGYLPDMNKHWYTTKSQLLMNFSPDFYIWIIKHIFRFLYVILLYNAYTKGWNKVLKLLISFRHGKILLWLADDSPQIVDVTCFRFWTVCANAWKVFDTFFDNCVDVYWIYVINDWIRMILLKYCFF